MNKVRKKIEELKRSIPFLKEKVRRNVAVQYWKARVRKERGKVVDKGAMEARKKFIENNSNSLTIEEIEHRLKKEKRIFRELIIIG